MEYLITPKYCDSNSILLINQTGLLRRLYCPFIVHCLTAIGGLEPGTQIRVDEVSVSIQDELQYCIMGRLYSYRSFEIRISF
jgi:hypothetical protein